MIALLLAALSALVAACGGGAAFSPIDAVALDLERPTFLYFYTDG
ncbi:MAG: hypothetical protein M5U14_19595 [Acidimicrobiia bacterium]|nr:hypothetical protein [Acidimicrobiia bacterium]